MKAWEDAVQTIKTEALIIPNSNGNQIPYYFLLFLSNNKILLLKQKI
jgi:hypothetical protein